MKYIKWLSTYFKQVTISTVPNQNRAVVKCYLSDKVCNTNYLLIGKTWEEISKISFDGSKLHALAAYTKANTTIDSLPISNSK